MINRLLSKLADKINSWEFNEDIKQTAKRTKMRMQRYHGEDELTFRDKVKGFIYGHLKHYIPESYFAR